MRYHQLGQRFGGAEWAVALRVAEEQERHIVVGCIAVVEEHTLVGQAVGRHWPLLRPRRWFGSEACQLAPPVVVRVAADTGARWPVTLELPEDWLDSFVYRSHCLLPTPFISFALVSPVCGAVYSAQ